MKLLALIVAGAALAADFVALPANTYHVQGVDVDEATMWVSSVDKEGKRGFLFQFDRRTGKLIHSVEVQKGDRYHPGGMSLNGGSIWIPVAEYRRDSSAAVQRRDKRTLV